MSWTKTWPLEPGWYWFWDPEFSEIVEPARMFTAGGRSQYNMYTRAGEMLYESNYQGVMWHPMQQAPSPPGAAHDSLDPHE